MTTTLNFPSSHHINSAKIHTGLLINNKWQSSESGKTFEVVNPSDESVICKVSEASAKDVDHAVAAARAAFKVYGQHTPGAERSRMMNKLADLLDRDKEILASIEALDNGKPYSMALIDLGIVIEVFRYYAGWADKIFGQTIETADDTAFNYTRMEPIGVCGQIIPWNFPLLMWSWKLGPAFATGCTVVMKTAEQTPLSALYASQLVIEAGFPAGVYNLVMGFGSITGAAIASHMDVDKVAFTGSTLVGRTIAKAAANSNLKKVSLELGGKSPSIIFESADLLEAASWANFGIYFNGGQCCTAGSRLFVQDSIYDKFIEQFKKTAEKIVTGDAFSKSSFTGPLVSKVQHDRVMSYIEAGKKEGATVEIGGKVHGNKGYYVEPTVFTNAKPGMKICREEIFGPVVVISKFSNEDDLIEQANDTDYGLAAAVFSTNGTQALRVAHKLKAGTVWVNKYNTFSASVPFGGFKASGWGRELGPAGLHNYLESKSVQVNLGMAPPM